MQDIIEDEYSDEMGLSFSIPQGSYPGPVLYLAYASTLKDTVPIDMDLYGHVDVHAVKNDFDPSCRRQKMDTIKSIKMILAVIWNIVQLSTYGY